MLVIEPGQRRVRARGDTRAGGRFEGLRRLERHRHPPHPDRPRGKLMTMKPLPPALRFVSPRELAERLEAERRGTPFLLYLDDGRRQHIVDLAPGTRAEHRSRAGERRQLDVGHRGVARARDARARRRRVDARRRRAVAQRLVRQRAARARAPAARRRRRDRGRARRSSCSSRPGAQVRTTVTTTSGAPPDLSPAQQRVLDALCRPALEGPLAAPAANREIAAELFLEGRDRQEPHARAVRPVRGPGHATEPQARRARQARVRARRDSALDRAVAASRRTAADRPASAARRGQRRMPSEPNGLSRPNSWLSRSVTNTALGTAVDQRAQAARSQRAWSRGPPVNAGSHLVLGPRRVAGLGHPQRAGEARRGGTSPAPRRAAPGRRERARAGGRWRRRRGRSADTLLSCSAAAMNAPFDVREAADGDRRVRPRRADALRPRAPAQRA